MASINHTRVDLKEAAQLILSIGDTNTVLLRGRPGIGKSDLLKTLRAALPDYLPCYIDVANLDLGDLGMPVIDREDMVTHYAPNARFGISPNSRQPVILMLDELGKASRPVLNMLLPVILERRLGDVHLPAGSIVFATTNLDTDGVGDNIPAHAYNRMVVVETSGPSSEQWLEWAADHNVQPEVMAFAKQYPQVFECYTELEKHDTNPYIFNPMAGQTRHFVSPRSLAAASTLVSKQTSIASALLPALVGTIGEAGARDMEAMLHLAQQLPSFESIVAAPAKAHIPESPAAMFILAFLCAGRVQADSLDAVMEYVNRWESFEAHTLFIATLASGKKVAIACRNREFTKAAAKAGKYF